MTSFTLKRRQKSLTRLERSGLSHSSVEGPFGDKSDLSTNTRRDHLDDHHVSSSFTEAMQNPDWRRRLDNSSSSSSDQPRVEIPQRDRIEQNVRTEEKNSKFGSLVHRDTGSIDQWDCVMASSLKSALDSCTADAQLNEEGANLFESMSSSDEGWVICNLLDGKEFNGRVVNGKEISIIEVVPVSSQTRLQTPANGLSFPSLAKIQRVNNDNRHLLPTPSILTKPDQEEILAASMAVAEQTPPRLCALPSGHRPQNKYRRDESSSTNNSEKLQHEIITELAARPNPPTIKEQNLLDTKHLTTTQTAACHVAPGLQKKHMAFQRMLQKLQRGANQASRVP
ncbi:hypothetical protein BGZ63DRAFT_214065 [Mariannaea sp. PMI_226]|nr:hypothetical protein BGZ63DRAFT_214065 [Mariannaea sp. PMI_226]